jgi:hypothetical protein
LFVFCSWLSGIEMDQNGSKRIVRRQQKWESRWAFFSREHGTLREGHQ